MFQNYKQLPRSYVMGTLIRRREDPEYATELMNEIGTTDMAIGDATAEVMLTTIGKIPNEMYDLEETSIAPGMAMAMAEVHQDASLSMDVKNTDSGSGFAAHSTLFIVLTIALLLLLLACCAAACIIARARKSFLDSSSMECDAECDGAKQPLISSDKFSETTSKSSALSTRN